MIGWLFLIAQASSRGIITGYVFDAVSGEPLVGANVLIDSLRIGTATDLDGAYVLRVPPGVHTVQVSMLGYQTKQQKVTVRAGETRRLDFYLPQDVIEVEKVEVTARPLVEKEEVTTVRSLSLTEIQNLPATETPEDVLQKFSGVQVEGRAIHIRGGRGNEVALVVDGIPVRDPLSGSALTLELPTSALEELEALISGYQAEYGNAMSGVIRLNIREGGDRLSGRLRLRTDSPLLWVYKRNHLMDFSLEGPLPVRNLTFFSALRLEGNNTYLPYRDNLKSSLFGRTFPFAENTFSLVGKVTWHPTARWKFSLTHTYTGEVSQGYEYSRYDYPFAYRFPYRYMYHLEGYPVFNREGVSTILGIYRITSRSLTELRFSRFFSHLRLDVDGKHWTEYRPFDDVVDNIEGGEGGDGWFWDTGDAPFWHDHFSETFTGKLDWTWFFSSIHQFKTGLQLDWMNLQWLDIQYPWYYDPEGLGLNHDLFNVHTYTGAVYVQDRIHFAGMVAHVGLRLDGWAPGRFLEDAVVRRLQDPGLHPFVRSQFEQFLKEVPEIGGQRVRLYLSPRFGVSFPISDRDKFFFSYGRFSQLPDLKYVYTRLGDRTTSSYELFGNPALRPTLTVAYEAGFQHALDAYSVLEVNAYAKDIFNYPTAIRVPGIPPNPSFWMYVNSDYARSLGLELALSRRFDPHLSYRLEATVSQAKGRSSTAEDALFRPQERTLREEFLRWDRPWKLYAHVAYRTQEGERIAFLPDRFYAALSVSFMAGRRYTPVDSLGNRGERYSRVGPPWKRVDLTLSRDFRVSGRDLRIRLEVRNLFNWRNAYYVNPLTGKPYEPGDPLPPRAFEIAYLNPARYTEGRSVYVEASIRF